MGHNPREITLLVHYQNLIIPYFQGAVNQGVPAVGEDSVHLDGGLVQHLLELLQRVASDADIPFRRHVSDVLQCPEWIVQYLEKVLTSIL